MLQTAFNGVVSGVIMTLPALAVTLLFGVLKFPNFAIGAMMTCAAYLVFALNAQLGWPLSVSTALIALAFGGVCILIDQVTFKPLRGRGAITLMVEQNAIEALGISDVCMVLAGGRVRFCAPASEVLGRDDLHSLYLGDTRETA